MANICKDAVVIPQQNNEGQQYEVDYVVDRKNSKSGLMYLVKWKGYSIDEATWQPVTNLFNSLEAVKQYEKKMQQLKISELEGKQKNSENQVDEYSKYKCKNKRIFKEHLIFPKQIKFQSKKEAQIRGGRKGRCKKLIKNKGPQKFSIRKHIAKDQIEIPDSNNNSSNIQFFEKSSQQLNENCDNLKSKEENKQNNIAKLKEVVEDNLGEQNKQEQNSSQSNVQQQCKPILNNLNPHKSPKSNN